MNDYSNPEIRPQSPEEVPVAPEPGDDIGALSKCNAEGAFTPDGIDTRPIDRNYTPTPPPPPASAPAASGKTSWFSYRGKIGRMGYAATWAALSGYFLGMGIIGINIDGKSYEMAIAMPLMSGYLVVAYLLIPQGAKRCHDLGHSGWWQLIPGYILVMLLGKGR